MSTKQAPRARGDRFATSASTRVLISQWKRAQHKRKHTSPYFTVKTGSTQTQAQVSLFHSENGLNTNASTRVLISQWKRAQHKRKHTSPYFTVKTGSTQTQAQVSLFHSENGLNTNASTSVLISQWKRAQHKCKYNWVLISQKKRAEWKRKHKSSRFTVKTGSIQGKHKSPFSQWKRPNTRLVKSWGNYMDSRHLTSVSYFALEKWRVCEAPWCEAHPSNWSLPRFSCAAAAGMRRVSVRMPAPSPPSPWVCSEAAWFAVSAPLLCLNWRRQSCPAHPWKNE